MASPNKQLVQDVASACRMKSLIICKVITDDQNPVAMLPALLAHLHNLRMFVEYTWYRLRIPLIIINLLIVFHVHVKTYALLDGFPG